MGWGDAWTVGALAASLMSSVCCLLPTVQASVRARAFTLVMSATMIWHTATSESPLATVLAVVLLAFGAIVTAAGGRRAPDPDAVLHRSIGAILMSGILLLHLGHTEATASHHHGLLTPLLTLSVAVFVVWTSAGLTRTRHRRDNIPAKIEKAGMAASTLFMLASALLGM
jgi:hypothetical protein